MIFPQVDGRELLYTLYKQNPDLCRQAIGDIRQQADTEKRNRTDTSGNYKVPDQRVLDKIRFEYAKQLSEVFFGSDVTKVAAFTNFLKNKVQKKPPGDFPLPFCWQKLFDKILDPAKEMKSLAAKQNCQNAKDSNENQIYCLFERYNREIAQLNFGQLATEIDDRASRVSDFKTALRNWARNSSSQPQGTQLQKLFTITNFAQNFMDWQDELVRELIRPQDHPRPAPKPQFRLLSQRLVAFFTEVDTFLNTQKRDKEFHAIKGFSWHEIAILVADGMRYDVMTQGMEIEEPDDFVRLLQRDRPAAAAKLAKIP